MHERFESIIFILAACVLIAVTGYVFFTSRMTSDERAQKSDMLEVHIQPSNDL